MTCSVNLEITSKGSAIDYDPWSTGKGAGHIHCMTFELLGNRSVCPKTGRPTGSRDYAEGVKITKRLDATSTTLMDLFTQNVGLTATFTFHMANVFNDHDRNQVALKVTLGGGDKMVPDSSWIRSWRLVSPDSEVAAGNKTHEPYEEVIFSFSNIEVERSGKNQRGAPVAKVAQDNLCQIGA